MFNENKLQIGVIVDTIVKYVRTILIHVVKAQLSFPLVFCSIFVKNKEIIVVFMQYKIGRK